MKMILTRDQSGEINGWLVPLWHTDSGVRIDQVYMTAVRPGAVKGPHLHHYRFGRFVCVSGDVTIVTRINGEYIENRTGEANDFAQVDVPPGTPAAIYNRSNREAIVINMPSPPWRVDDQDEWPVEGWTYA